MEKPWIGLDHLIQMLPFSRQVKQKMMVQKYGVIGTILFHLIVVALFLAIKISNKEKPHDSWVFIDLKTMEELNQMLIQQNQENRDQRFNQSARNIAVDRTEDRIERYDQNPQMSRQAVDRLVNSRINQAVKEIIEENDLNPDDKELPDIQSKPLDFYQARPVEEEKVYEGPTNIYYRLDNRSVVKLYVPVYKCQGSATVRVDIRVGQRGKVEWATISNTETDTRDQCFLKAAKDAAERTRFNFSTDAPLLQQGYILYHFIAQ